MSCARKDGIWVTEFREKVNIRLSSIAESGVRRSENQAFRSARPPDRPRILRAALSGTFWSMLSFSEAARRGRAMAS